MENKQNRTSQTQSGMSQSSQNSSQSNMSSSSSSSPSMSSSNTGSNVGNQQNSRSGSSSNSGSSSKIGGMDMNNITNKLQEFGNTAMNKVNNLSTTQKVVGGSLLALGAGWLAMNSRNKSKSKSHLKTTRSNKFGRTSS